LDALPPFDEFGNLPPGIHRCTTGELIQRFGHGSPERETQASELVRFIEMARLARVRRLLVNGSFVTAKAAPNDVDVVILPDSRFADDSRRLEPDELVWPFLQIIVAADDADFEAWATTQFGTDRQRRPKGVVEISL
jgi:hypothetical protein